MFNVEQCDGSFDCRVFGAFYDDYYDESKFKVRTPGPDAGARIKEIPYESSKRKWNEDGWWELNIGTLYLTLFHLTSSGYSVSIEREVLKHFENETGIPVVLEEEDYDQGPQAEDTSPSSVEVGEVEIKDL